MTKECWDYRVLRREGMTGEIFYGIHEVFFDDAGRAWGCTVEPVAAVGYDLEDLADELELLAAALKQPVLEYDAIPEEGAESPAIDFNDDPGTIPLRDLLEELGFDEE
jgi:hypothetical protein